MEAALSRLVVAGGFGVFGAAAVARLRAAGERPLAASRRDGADLRLDVEDPASLRATLRRGDVVVDAVGPFQHRTTALVAAAADLGFDVVDISDSLDHVRAVRALRERIDAAGIRVLCACSTLSAVSAAMIRLSGLAAPVGFTCVLAPATRYTARPGTAGSLVASVGAPVDVLRDGQLVRRIAWREARTFTLPAPVGAVRARLLGGGPDALLLPEVWPSLRHTSFYVHSNVPGLDALLAAAARWPRLLRRIGTPAPALALARLLGARRGWVLYEVEDAGGRLVRCLLTGEGRSYDAAVVPAVLAARALAAGTFSARGLVPPDRHVAPDVLLAALRDAGLARVALPSD